jgi:glutathionylspermidine amidase/synthetase
MHRQMSQPVQTEMIVKYGVYMGIKWQCVEYARRWLFIRKGCIFDSIDGAADMWTQLNNVQRVVDSKTFPLINYPNDSPTPPRNESLLIYQRYGTDMPFGHVSVIVDVLPNFIRVAEENYDAYYWSGNYSRQIQYVYINGSYVIQDDYPILGWMSVNDSNQTKPLDQSTISAILLLNRSSQHFVCHSLLFFIFFYLEFCAE